MLWTQVLVPCVVCGDCRGHAGEMIRRASRRPTSTTQLRRRRVLGGRRRAAAVPLAMPSSSLRRLQRRSKTSVDRRRRRPCRATGIRRRCLGVIIAVGQPSTGHTVQLTDQQTGGTGCRRTDAPTSRPVTIYWISCSRKIEDQVLVTARLLSTTVSGVAWAVFVVDVDRR